MCYIMVIGYLLAILAMSILWIPLEFLLGAILITMIKHGVLTISDERLE